MMRSFRTPAVTCGKLYISACVCLSVRVCRLGFCFSSPDLLSVYVFPFTKSAPAALHAAVNSILHSFHRKLFLVLTSVMVGSIVYVTLCTDSGTDSTYRTPFKVNNLLSTPLQKPWKDKRLDMLL